MKNIIFKGSCTALVTPLSNSAKRVNYKKLRELIDFQIEAGTSAIVLLGTTGAPTTLTEYERENIVKTAVGHVAGRVPIIVGAGSNCTKTAIKQSQTYEKLGADALLHVTPYYNKCTQKGLVEHFSIIAKSVELPIVLYNVPGRTGVNMLPSTVEKLSHVNNIVAVKEASGNIEQISEVIRICSKEFSVYSGDDALTFLTLCLGGRGVISVASNIIPEVMSKICKEYFSGNYENGKNLQLGINPLIKTLFCEVNPIPVITAMNMLGYDVGGMRLPLSSMEEDNVLKLKNELKKLFGGELR